MPSSARGTRATSQTLFVKESIEVATWVKGSYVLEKEVTLFSGCTVAQGSVPFNPL